MHQGWQHVADALVPFCAGNTDGPSQDTAPKTANGSPNLQASGNNALPALKWYWDTNTGRGMNSLEAYSCLEDYVTDKASAHSSAEVPLLMLVSDPLDMRKPFVVAGGIASKKVLVRGHELAVITDGSHCINSVACGCGADQHVILQGLVGAPVVACH